MSQQNRRKTNINWKIEIQPIRKSMLTYRRCSYIESTFLQYKVFGPWGTRTTKQTSLRDEKDSKQTGCNNAKSSSTICQRAWSNWNENWNERRCKTSSLGRSQKVALLACNTHRNPISVGGAIYYDEDVERMQRNAILYVTTFNGRNSRYCNIQRQIAKQEWRSLSHQSLKME